MNIHFLFLNGKLTGSLCWFCLYGLCACTQIDWLIEHWKSEREHQAEDGTLGVNISVNRFDTACKIDWAFLYMLPDMVPGALIRTDH